MKRLDTTAKNFAADLQQLLAGEVTDDRQYRAIVDDIIQQVRADGDRALIALSNRLDRLAVKLDSRAANHRGTTHCRHGAPQLTNLTGTAASG